MGKTIYITEEQYLKEFTNDDSNAFAEPTLSNNQNMGSAIDKTKSNNPSDDNIVVDTNLFDGNNNNNPIKLDVNAKNGSDAEKQINTMMRSNPQLKQIQNNGKLMANVHLEGTTYKKKQISEMRLGKLKENSVTLTKEKLDEIFNR